MEPAAISKVEKKDKVEGVGYAYLPWHFVKNKCRLLANLYFLLTDSHKSKNSVVL